MIGVFDSGYGGLTILKELMSGLPGYDYFYLGDNARAPYGIRSKETLAGFGEEAMEYLFKQGCVLIVIACNSLSSSVLPYLQEKYLRAPDAKDRKILGVVRPLAEEAVKISKTGKIGVVGTSRTIESNAFELEIKHLRADVMIFKQACPLLVPLIEENWYKKPETRMILKKYLTYLKSCNIDALILACTHYPFLFGDFCRIMGKNVAIPHPGKVITESLKSYLDRHPEIEVRLAKNSKRHYATTDNAEKFKKTGSEFLGQKLEKVAQVKLRNIQ